MTQMHGVTELINVIDFIYRKDMLHWMLVARMPLDTYMKFAHVPRKGEEVQFENNATFIVSSVRTTIKHKVPVRVRVIVLAAGALAQKMISEGEHHYGHPP